MFMNLFSGGVPEVERLLSHLAKHSDFKEQAQGQGKDIAWILILCQLEICLLNLLHI
jgi:hypothetical protein